MNRRYTTRYATAFLPAWLQQLDMLSQSGAGQEEYAGRLSLCGRCHSFSIMSAAMQVAPASLRAEASIIIKLAMPDVRDTAPCAWLTLDTMAAQNPPIPFAVANQLYLEGQLPAHLQPSVSQLLQLSSQLNEPLRSFLYSVFSDRELARAFVTVSASINHHHAWQGGLLVHSVESAVMVQQLATRWMTPVEAQITIVAALLHDIGKTRTFQASGHWSELGHYISHDAMTLEILAPHLAELEKTWRTGANMLRHILGWNRQDKRFPAFPGTQLIKMCDQFSTALSLRETCFHGKPSWHQYARYNGINAQRFLRLPG